MGDFVYGTMKSIVSFHYSLFFSIHFSIQILLCLVPIIFCVKLVPIVRMLSSEGVFLRIFIISHLFVSVQDWIRIHSMEMKQLHWERRVSRSSVIQYFLVITFAILSHWYKYFCLEEAGYLLSVEEYDNLKEKCPDLRAIIRYATNFGVYSIHSHFFLNELLD